LNSNAVTKPLLLLFVVLALLLFGGVLLMLRGYDNRIGAGKHVESPDGRFDAEGMVLSRLRAGHEWLRLRVTDRSNGNVIWESERKIATSSNRPGYDQGRADERLIEWSDDSASVDFKDEAGEWITVIVADETAK
jgi:hypothetical protein